MWVWMRPSSMGEKVLVYNGESEWRLNCVIEWVLMWAVYTFRFTLARNSAWIGVDESVVDCDGSWRAMMSGVLDGEI